jgi:dienelactone hydrolase
MKLFTAVFSVLFLPAVIWGQKKPLSVQDFDQWKSIVSPQISKDGKFVWWEETPQEGDGKLFFRDVAKSELRSFERARDARMMPGNSHLVFRVVPTYAEVREAKRKKVKKEDMPKDHLVIWNIQTAKSDTVKGISSYSCPDESGSWIAVLLEDKKEKKEEKKPVEEPKKKKKHEEVKPVPPKSPSKKPEGKTLRLIPVNYPTAYREFKYVNQFLLSNYDAADFFFMRESGDSLHPKGLFVHNLNKNNTAMIDSSFKGCSGISANKKHTMLAYLTTPDTAKSEVRIYTLFVWDGKSSVKVLDTATTGLSKGWMPSADLTPVIDENGKYLLVGTRPIPGIQPKDTLQLDEEKVKLDIWHWRDEDLQTVQNKNKSRDEKKSYLGRINLSDGQFMQLADEQFEISSYPRDTVQTWFTATVSKPYKVMQSWMLPSPADHYLIDVGSGERIALEKELRARVSLSPGSRYAYWYDGKARHWFAYDIAARRKINLTEKIGFPVWDEDDDTPDDPGSYGMAGWIHDSIFVVYDRFDVWEVRPSNPAKPLSITRGMGRKAKIRFRVQRIERKSRTLDADEWILTAVNTVNKDEAVWHFDRLTFTMTPLSKPEPFTFSSFTKAENSQALIFRKGNFTQYPELYLTNMDYELPQKISETNTQQKDYAWGTVSLVSWKSYSGKPLTGLLYKPEDFDTLKTYPVIVYFYESYSDQLHQYYSPAPSASTVNFTQCISNGYLVFVPDIVYQKGDPGKSAFDCILSGVAELTKNKWVDASRMGIQGQSWGGYQVAFLVTQTNMFRCAMAGAPVSNMTSAYGGIRWESGMSRQFQYERSQSRLGKTMWQDRNMYIRNSPVFYADKVQTPLLMMHNDEDGAVPWYQGIEYYMALRRLEKPVWMLVYNGEGHNLTKRHNRKDLTIRMMQFFDHYLKGAPAPEWMVEGRKAVDKEKISALELMEEQ